jgi:uncharacterized membrane protein
MIERRYQRVWIVIAAIAIVAALVLMLVPQGHSGDGAWLAVLPVLFIGVIAPLRLLAFLERFDAGRAHDAPAFEPSFQRPPPFRLG